jgi:hypothetical protein
MDGSRAIIGTLTVGSATTANDDDHGGDIREGGVDVVIADGDGADVAGSTVGSVMKYELGTSEWRGFASRMDENRQTLIDASIFIEEYDYRTDEQQRPDDDVGDDKITIVIGGDDNDIDEDDIVMTNAKGRRIVMTFGKLLIEDDGWDVYDLPIYERGNNHFLFARGRYGGNGDGGANELGYHAVRATFVKDFDDDITDVSFSLCFVPLLDALGGGGVGGWASGVAGRRGVGGGGGIEILFLRRFPFRGRRPAVGPHDVPVCAPTGVTSGLGWVSSFPRAQSMGDRRWFVLCSSYGGMSSSNFARQIGADGKNPAALFSNYTMLTPCFVLFCSVLFIILSLPQTSPSFVHSTIETPVSHAVADGTRRALLLHLGRG